jgi:hypothetical protein
LKKAYILQKKVKGIIGGMPLKEFGFYGSLLELGSQMDNIVR